MATYATTTRSTLRTRIRERLISNFWSDTELNLLINEGLRVWNTLTGFFRTSASIPSLAASSVGYATTSIASDVMAILRMDSGSTHLDPIQQQDLAIFVPQWHVQTPATPIYWIPQGLNRFQFYPTPISTTALTVDYVAAATIPTADGDFIQLGEEDMDALLDYIYFAAKMKEGGVELQNAIPYLQNFLRQAAKHNASLLSLGVFRRMLGIPSGGQKDPRTAESGRAR